MLRQSRVPVSEFKAAEKASTSNQIACVLALEKPLLSNTYQSIICLSGVAWLGIKGINQRSCPL